MFMKTLRLASAFVLTTSLLVACDGGGGSSTPDPDQINAAKLAGTIKPWP